jgi:hypothetical protein
VEPARDSSLTIKTDKNSVLAQTTLRQRAPHAGGTQPGQMCQHIRTIVAGITPAHVVSEQRAVGRQVASLEGAS